ncbi:DUF58 domain-containing protein [Neisseria zoodegmatis]|uniref:Uncharacterized conserved protein (Some members contain a von Willebrand factor type A (VWA) domain) n=1 Tax=Neisseria zoodegmatis TaxID=326523 RepID=A0AB38DNA7_9NEIS|nr:DUF58 domain-containing protein [Neisseria zoodegmatis]OSI09174.1 hypothetical protein BWD10_10350 [Neisseria zoodegmatis]SNU78731.1 Uncharacterized conserved protein (some members contain a von Willebrand factor type A (vWA) domain) [Neisseria zoodegmatis]
MWPSRKHKLPAVAGRSPDLASLHCRPTRLGAGLLVTVLLLWLVGLNYQVNLAYAAAFWLAGFLAVAVLLNLRQLLDVQIDVNMPKEVFAGHTAVLELTARQNSRRRWLWLCSEDDFLNPNQTAAKLWQPWQVNSDGLSVYHWQIPALMRGYLRVPPLRTAAVAPFGMSMVQCVWHWPSDAVVFPAPIPHDLPDGRERGGETDRKRAPVQGGDDLSYLQPHQEGASLQHVAWKAYAKTGQMLDKRFEEPQTAVRNTVISYLDYPAGTSKDRLAGLLCFRVLEAERSGQTYSLELPQRVIAPQKGQREICLTALGLW